MKLTKEEKEYGLRFFAKRHKKVKALKEFCQEEECFIGVKYDLLLRELLLIESILAKLDKE
jgi:hypothetical protein